MVSRNDPRDDSPKTSVKEASPEKRILVIGAGMSGMLMAIQLLKSGRSNIVVYEKAQQIGGTWRDNVYPGLKCDVPAAMFSYSFEPNKEYSSRFPMGSEIQDYLLSISDRYGLNQFIQFNKTVETVNWEDGRWYVQTSDGLIESFDIVINATGVLHYPYIPNIEGHEQFQGSSFHTARWREDMDWKGKKVGVIGSGATSVQVFPELVRESQHVTLFQRTAQWIFPIPNKAYTETDRKRMREEPGLIDRLRFRYSKLFQWTFSRAVIGNAFLLWAIGAFCRSHLRRKVKDPELRKKLTPQDKCGCKRLIFAKGFYQALQESNATLCTDAIERVVPDGIQTSDGRIHKLDVIIYATGFQVHRRMKPMHVVGREGKTMDETWSKGAVAHRSTTIPGFPNFFAIFGPYSPIGNYSAFSVAEVQVGHILRTIEHMESLGHDLIEPSEEATERLVNKMNRAMKKTVWMSGCKSWYQDADGNIPMWPWTFERYEREMSKLNAGDFRTACRDSQERPRVPKIRFLDYNLESSARTPTSILTHDNRIATLQ